MKIAILGFGTVGSGAYEVTKFASDIEVARIFTRSVKKEYEDIADRFTNDIRDITEDPEIGLVIEAIGGVDLPRKLVLECLDAGKHVVTPNKDLISACFGELTEAAERNGVQLRFTAAAGGGIPWLYNLLRTRRCDVIKEVRGIVNGTCNYILDAMCDNGADFDEMLRKAKELGYAEADPSADIEGTDTLRKTVISSNLAYGTVIKEEDVSCYGIDTIKACDVEYLREKGLVPKLMMNSKCEGGVVSAYVEPVAFPVTSLEAGVKANNNLITLEAVNVGTLSFCGQGAGKMPTGQSVVQDVIDVRDGVDMYALAKGDAEVKVDNDRAVHRYYLRHDHMCEHIEPMIDSYEERDGIYYCITKPVSVNEMHKMGHHRKEKRRELFFAALTE